MGNEKIKRKGLLDSRIEVNNDLDLINEHTIEPLSAGDVFTFKVRLCDNDVDRVGDKMSDEFLHEVAENVRGLTGLKDHDWSSDNQTSRLYDAEVVEDGQLNKVGEPRKYVLGKAYTLRRFEDYIAKINAGLLKEVSISFESEGDTCSICGEEMVKGGDEVGCCCNGHKAGEVYDGVLCYNNINKLKDLLEWSLVAVPCQRNAGIKNKSITGGNIMKRAELLIRQFMTGKAFGQADESDKQMLEKAISDTEDKELSDEDIKVILDENAKMKEKIKGLEAKVKEAESGRTRDKMEAIVDKEFDKLGLITPEVKELLKKEIPWDDLAMEDGQIPGLADVFAGMKDKYKGLFVEDKEDEDDGGEEKVEVREDEDEDEVKVEERKEKGIKLGVNSKRYDKQVSKVKPGIYFN